MGGTGGTISGGIACAAGAVEASARTGLARGARVVGDSPAQTAGHKCLAGRLPMLRKSRVRAPPLCSHSGAVVHDVPHFGCERVRLRLKIAQQLEKHRADHQAHLRVPARLPGQGFERALLGAANTSCQARARVQSTPRLRRSTCRARYVPPGRGTTRRPKSRAARRCREARDTSPNSSSAGAENCLPATRIPTCAPQRARACA